MSEVRPKTKPKQAASAEPDGGLPDLEIKEGLLSKLRVKIGEIVKKHPRETLNLIRRWLRNRNNRNH